MPLSDEAIEARKHAIGSSDIAGLVLGQDAINLYARLTQEYPPPHFDNPAMERGNRLEDTVAAWVGETYNSDIHPGTLERHPHWQFEIANLDRWISTQIGRLPLEVKTAAGGKAWEWGEADSDVVPLNYQLQVQWQLWVTQKPVAWLGVLIGGHEFEYRRYIIKADPELQEMLHTAAYAFVTQHVQPRVPPEPSGSEAYTKWLQRRYPKSTDLMLGATADIDNLVNQYESYCETAAKAEKLADATKQQLIGIIADAAGIEGAGYRLTYKAPKDSRRWNLETLESDHPELAGKYTKLVPGSRRFILRRFKK